LTLGVKRVTFRVLDLVPRVSLEREKGRRETLGTRLERLFGNTATGYTKVS